MIPRIANCSVTYLPKNCFIFLNDGSSKMTKNVFYFILKAFLVLKIFKFFFLTFRLYSKNGLIITSKVARAWSVNEIKQEEIFSSKIMHKMRQ